MILVTLQHFVQAGGFAAVPDVLTPEALVAKEGLELAVECGVYKTILEVDCSELKMVLCSQMMARDHQSAVFVSISRSSASAVFVSISQRWVGVVAILELLGSVGMLIQLPIVVIVWVRTEGLFGCRSY